MKLFEGKNKKEAYDELKAVDYSMYNPETVKKYEKILKHNSFIYLYFYYGKYWRIKCFCFRFFFK